MLSDYERRVLAEFESEFRDGATPQRARNSRTVHYSRLAGACVVMVSALLLAAALPLPTVGAAILGAVVGPLAGLTVAEALVRPRPKARADTAQDSSTVR